MNPLSYHLADRSDDAIAQAATRGARFLAGGTNLVDLLRQNVERADALIDVSRLSSAIEDREDGRLLVGAGVTNAALAADSRVRQRFPFLSRAVLAGASPQIRNMATVGGNLLQRTRCTYFFDAAGASCNNRAPGTGCDAIGGFTRYHAIFGASEHCIATHPSDMCVALAALDGVIHVEGPAGARTIPISDFHLLPGDTPHHETALHEGELITAVELPAGSFLMSTYRKVRDRSSYAFALVSVAAVLEVEDGRIADARIALGGVAAKPWRACGAEAMLLGHPPSTRLYRDAIERELTDARPLPGNEFKLTLVRNTVVAILGELAGEAR